MSYRRAWRSPILWPFAFVTLAAVISLLSFTANAQPPISPNGLPVTERADFLAREAALNERLYEFNARVAANRSECGSVDPDNSSLVAHCQDEKKQLGDLWNRLGVDVNAYNRDVRLALASEKYRQALVGLKGSLQAFGYDAEAVGLKDLGDDLKIGLLPGVLAALAAMKAPGTAAGVASFAALVKVTNFLNNFPDCSFDQADLKIDCLNSKDFAVKADEAKQKIQELESAAKD